MDKGQDVSQIAAIPSASTFNELPMDRVIVRNDSLFTAPFDDDLVCLDEATGHYYGLNKTARIIWEMLESPITLQGVIEVMVQHFSKSNNEITTDVSDFIMELHAIHMMSFSEPLIDRSALSSNLSQLKLLENTNIEYIAPVITTILPTAISNKNAFSPAEFSASLGPS